MRAIVLKAPGGVENFELVEWPEPALRPGDVRIRVAAVSFNPVDVQIRRGDIALDAAHGPLVLGRDLSGVVEAVAPDVDAFRPGDAVYAAVARRASSGTYAELVNVPEELVAAKPRCLSHEQAAAVPVAGLTASLALRKLRAGPARSLFIAGAAGGVGSFAVLLARSGVRRVVATAGSAASRRHLVERCGLPEDCLVDSRAGDVVAAALARNGGPFDAVLDLVGGALLAACCRLVDLDGDVASAVDAPAAADFEHLFDRNASFHAVGAHAHTLTEDRVRWRETGRTLAQLAAQMDAGALPPPHVERVGPFALETVRQAHERLQSGGMQGKLVMSVDASSLQARPIRSRAR
jgi:NADPH2:quinone reductase